MELFLSDTINFRFTPIAVVKLCVCNFYNTTVGSYRDQSKAVTGEDEQSRMIF